MNKQNVNKVLEITSDFIGGLLFIAGVLNFISYLIYAFSEEINDTWFIRQCISFICFGFAGIIFKLRKN